MLLLLEKCKFYNRQCSESKSSLVACCFVSGLPNLSPNIIEKPQFLGRFIFPDMPFYFMGLIYSIQEELQ